MENKKIKIAILFGGRITKHLRLIKKAGKEFGVDLDLVSYNRIVFDSQNGQVMIRRGLKSKKGWMRADIYDVLFFRTTGKHWEEVDLLLRTYRDKEVVVVDPLVEMGKSSRACKAYQMLALKGAGIEVPRTIYGSLMFLKKYAHNYFDFPLVIKGSGGDRGSRVFKVDNQLELDNLVKELRWMEIKEGKRFMAEEYIENDGDYRIIVLGDKVLGVMKRSRQKEGEFRNNYSAGGEVEVADLPEEIKKLAIKASKVCSLLVAGVDVVFRDGDIRKPVVWEVNKGPQFSGFMKATGIDVPKEMVKFLVRLGEK
ncbi:hypothetical protein DRH14_00060 [Candidatus Shapirobacteria bacterium]|nr:MAG: hypothetical protein DRH14_00060 [Candidatus Shapirobacteria bacterium]